MMNFSNLIDNGRKVALDAEVPEMLLAGRGYFASLNLLTFVQNVASSFMRDGGL